MKPDLYFQLLAKTQKRERTKVPTTLQGVSKSRIEAVLQAAGTPHSDDIVDAVFALLDDTIPSQFSRGRGYTLSSGATTAHIGAHVGIYQRRGKTKLDREGRDYWIKPLRNVGAIEPVTFANGVFVSGHPTAKSPNSAYRLSSEFVELLKTADAEIAGRVKAWIDGSAERQRGALRAEVAATARATDPSSHAGLIRVASEVYAARYLPDYEVIYVDSDDGDRVSDDERRALSRAGVALGLGDAYPDVLLWSPSTDRLWVIEAVTSDGEVDAAKVEAVTRLVERSGKNGVNFTTVYATWRDAARRQGPNRNLAVNTYLWIAEDPGRAFLVTSFSPMSTIESVPLASQ